MRRSICLALGIMAIIVGLETLVIDSVNLYSASSTDAQSFIDPSGRPSGALKRWEPNEWFPWIALMGGAIGVIYVFTLPKRFQRAA